MSVLSFEVLHILSFSAQERILCVFLATLDAKRNHQGQFGLPGNCNTFAALSGYLIKTSSMCVRWSWTFLLSLKLLSEEETPPESEGDKMCLKRARGRKWEQEEAGGDLVEHRYSVGSWKSLMMLLYWSDPTTVTHSKSIHK